MFAHFFKGHHQVAQGPADNLEIGTRLEERTLRHQVQFIDIIFNVLFGENESPVEGVNIKLGLCVFVSENKQIRKVDTLHRQFQFLSNQQVDHTQGNGISFSHLQHYVDHRIAG